MLYIQRQIINSFRPWMTSRRSQIFINATDVMPIKPTTGRSNFSDCKTLRFDGFIPWDNPDNLVSIEVEAFAERLKGAIVLPLLFLIGGPANVVNMAVFYKQGLRERINLCLFALSLADELYLIPVSYTHLRAHETA